MYHKNEDFFYSLLVSHLEIIKWSIKVDIHYAFYIYYNCKGDPTHIKLCGNYC